MWLFFTSFDLEKSIEDLLRFYFDFIISIEY